MHATTAAGLFGSVIFSLFTNSAVCAVLGPAPEPPVGGVAAAFPGITEGTYFFVDNPDNFSVGVGGPNIGNIPGIDLESASNTLAGEWWSIVLVVTADDGIVDDNISVAFTATHMKPPLPAADHPENGGGSPWTDSIQRDGSQGTGTSRDARSRPHGTHWDNFTTSLTATVVSTVNFDEITGWSYSIAGTHGAQQLHSVPEPPTSLLLLTAAFLCVFGAAKAKRQSASAVYFSKSPGIADQRNGARGSRMRAF